MCKLPVVASGSNSVKSSPVVVRQTALPVTTSTEILTIPELSEALRPVDTGDVLNRSRTTQPPSIQQTNPFAVRLQPPQSRTPSLDTIATDPNALKAQADPGWWQSLNVRESFSRTFPKTTALWHGAATWVGTQRDRGVALANEAWRYLRVTADELIDLGRRALGYAAKMIPLSQMTEVFSLPNGRRMDPNITCYRTCERMGQRAGMTFSPNGGPQTIQASAPGASDRMLRDLAAGIPVMCPVDYKEGGQRSGDAADHCVIIQGITSYNPIKVRVYDPRSVHRDIQVQEFVYNPQTQQLEGSRQPRDYRITQMRFATNVDRPFVA